MVENRFAAIRLANVVVHEIRKCAARFTARCKRTLVYSVEPTHTLVPLTSYAFRPRNEGSEPPLNRPDGGSCMAASVSGSDFLAGNGEGRADAWLSASIYSAARSRVPREQSLTTLSSMWLLRLRPHRPAGRRLASRRQARRWSRS